MRILMASIPTDSSQVPANFFPNRLVSMQASEPYDQKLQRKVKLYGENVTRMAMALACYFDNMQPTAASTINESSDGFYSH